MILLLFNQQQEWLKQPVPKTPDQPNETFVMLTVGTKEQRGDVKVAQQHRLEDFSQQFKTKPLQNFQVWSFQHPAEQHITNLYASLPKALLLAGCKDTQRCKQLLE